MIEGAKPLDIAAKGVHRAAFACGNFDGLHLGHRQLLSHLISLARFSQAAPAVLSFFPHPRAVLCGEPLPPLASPTQKRRLLADIGIEVLMEVPFVDEVARLSPEEFAFTYFAQPLLGVTDICVGRNWAFGRGRSGNADSLRALPLGFRVHEAEEFCLDGAPVSSSRIRCALGKGDFGLAARLLGRPWEIEGRVVRGVGIASSKLQFPTANLDCGVPLLPIAGVYAVRAFLAPGEASRPGLLNVGSAPTFPGKEAAPHQAELHLLDFSGDLYGRQISVLPVAHLRDERRFGSADELKAQILLDAAAARQILSRRG